MIWNSALQLEVEVATLRALCQDLALLREYRRRSVDALHRVIAEREAYPLPRRATENPAG